MTCTTSACGTGGWTGPLPGDPDNNSILSATPAFGGIDVSWTYPTTNPQAVSHVLLYRGISNDFNSSFVIAVVGGNFYYDKIEVTSTPVQYYYWIQIVSVNGTVGEKIGPASAYARKRIADVITDLTDQIDHGLLAASLKEEIGKITLNYQELVSEINNRVSANTALSAALATVQSGVNQSLTYIGQEITLRQEGDSALVSSVNSVAAANANNLALIQQETLARVSADNSLATSINTVASQTATNATNISNETIARTTQDNALALDISSLYSASSTNSSAVQTIQTAKIGYAIVTATGVPFDGDNSTVVYPSGIYSSALYPEYAFNRTRIIDKVGVTNWNALSVGLAKPLTWVTGMPLASAVQSVQVTGPDGSIASVQNAFSAQKDLNNNFKAQYTAKVNVNGLVGGFGIYNDGSVVEAGFDVDKFWIGRTGADKRKPFIISGGEVFINEAVINTLTFTKLRDESGTVMVEDGKIKANYLKVNEVAGGAYSSYAWPAAGQTGFYLGPSGLLMGNYNNGQWFQVDISTGTISMPGLNISGGNATFSGNLTANTVTTNSITGGAVTQTYASNTTGTSTSITVDVPAGAVSVNVLAYIGDPYMVTVGSGESAYNYMMVPSGTLKINGYDIVTQSGTLVYVFAAPGAGTYTMSIVRSIASGNLNLSAQVYKR